MSSISRPLADPMMTFDLAQHLAEMRSEEAYTRSGRAGRTLAKSGRLRVTLTVLAKGAEVGTHQADSPMTLQVLEGGITFRTGGGGEHTLRRGDLLFFGPGDANDIRATEETALLLTLSAVDDDFRPESSSASSASPAS